MSLPSGGRSPQSIVDERSRLLHQTLMDAAHAAVGVQAASQRAVSSGGTALSSTWLQSIARTARRSARYKRCRPADRTCSGSTRQSARTAYRAALKTAKDWARAELFRNVESSPHILNWLGYRRTLPRANKVNLNSVTNAAGALPLNTNESLHQLRHRNVQNCSAATTIDRARSHHCSSRLRRTALHRQPIGGLTQLVVHGG